MLASRSCLPAIAWLASGTSVAAAPDVIGFYPLGSLSSPVPQSRAWGISGDGSTIIGDSYNGDRWEATAWHSPGAAQPLGFLSTGEDSQARTASYDGAILGGWSGQPSGRHTAVWDVSGIRTIGSPNAGDFAYVNDMSPDGASMVGATTTGNGDGFFYSAQTGFQILPGLHSRGSDAKAMSDSGAIIAGRSKKGSGSEAMIWQGGVPTGLGYLDGGTDSQASAISADGQVVVGYSRSGQDWQPFRWTQATGTISLLPGAVPAGLLSGATAVSGDGSTIVGYYRHSGEDNGFLWDEENGLRPLTAVLQESGIATTGWRLQNPMAISDDGRSIVGFGVNPAGKEEGWLVVIPEPTSGLLLALALTLSARTRRP